MKVQLFKKHALSFLLVSLFFAFPLLALGQFDPGQGQSGTGLKSTSVYDIIRTIMMWLLMILTVVAVIGFIVSGLLFIIGGGSAMAEKAKGYLTYSFVGILVALIGYIAVKLVDRILGGNVQ